MVAVIVLLCVVASSVLQASATGVVGTAHSHNHYDYFAEGNMFYEQGMLADARASYERAKATSPAHADLLANYGSVLSDLGDLHGAEAEYDAALAVAPAHAAALFNLAMLLQVSAFCLLHSSLLASCLLIPSHPHAYTHTSPSTPPYPMHMLCCAMLCYAGAGPTAAQRSSEALPATSGGRAAGRGRMGEPRSRLPRLGYVTSPCHCMSLLFYTCCRYCRCYRYCRYWSATPSTLLQHPIVAPHLTTPTHPDQPIILHRAAGRGRRRL